MTSLNWGMISDGGTFESLVQALLYAEDPGVIVFGRPGPDSGQDARSADGKTIYQAKYHSGSYMTMSDAISRAFKELEQIKKYRESTHGNYQHWKDVEKWILVANILINPNDEAKWKSDVVPAYKSAVNIDAEYITLDKLEDMLAEHQHIREVFFEGENRVLISLKEAHDWLEEQLGGQGILEYPFIGREDELALVKTFAVSDSKKILPVIGAGGIGKTRFLYESLVALSDDGWRVLWALPNTMSISSQWFRILNGAQKTCVAIDSLDDARLLRAIVEQLAAVERKNWRIIISSGTEKSSYLQSYKKNNSVTDSINLKELSDSHSQELLETQITRHIESSWCHSIYRIMGGIPGWLSLVSKLTNEGALADLPENADEISSLYIQSCLDAITTVDHHVARELLQWIALWGTICIDGDDFEQKIVPFLNDRGIAASNILVILKELRDKELLDRWGIKGRFFTIKPTILQHQILSQWLLEYDDDYRVSSMGEQLLKDLINGEIPLLDVVLKTLTRLSMMRLSDDEIQSLFHPFFAELDNIAESGTTTEQFRVVDLVEKTGVTDLEAALEILIKIRKNPKKDDKIDNFWGEHILTHKRLVAKLPWVLFQLGEYIDDRGMALRFIEEFKQLYIEINNVDFDEYVERGNEPDRLIQRLLRESKNYWVFLKPAHDLVMSKIASVDEWPFIGIVAANLINPTLEFTEWSSRWVLSLRRRSLVPEDGDWRVSISIRNELFKHLHELENEDIRLNIWPILVEAHHDFHRVILHDKKIEQIRDEYREILLSDLSRTLSILENPPCKLSISEATLARGMWSWYLKYGEVDEFKTIAQKLEAVYEGLSDWRLHDFFVFEENSSEIKRIAERLIKTQNIDSYNAFFTESETYLAAVRKAGEDLADPWKIAKLADECIGDRNDLFEEPLKTMDKFVLSVLEKTDPQRLEWAFAVRVCERLILALKQRENYDELVEILNKLMACTHDKKELLISLYTCPHPNNIGQLSKQEYEYIYGHLSMFSMVEQMALLGPFCDKYWEDVRDVVEEKFTAEKDDQELINKAMNSFINAIYLAVLRYNWPSDIIPFKWIIDSITRYELDGNLMVASHVNQLRERLSYQMLIMDFVRFIESRISLDKKNEKPYEGFTVLPLHFCVSEWCIFDNSIEEHISAFIHLCELSLEDTFTSLYWLPKYIAELNEDGSLVAEFIERYLRDHSDLSLREIQKLAKLAASYPDDSKAWERIAKPICQCIVNFKRDDRQRIYSIFCCKETGVYSSPPGQVAPLYIDRCDLAQKLLDEEPHSVLREYREYALRIAKADIEREKEWVEEDFYE